MIQFECYPLSEKNIYLKIVTDHTEKGTLYRLFSAIFVLGMDIYSGEVKTLKEKNLSEDIFILRNNHNFASFNDFSYQLGILMESLLNRNQEPEKILNLNPKRKIPDLREIFKTGFEYIIEERKDKKQILFYFETTDRSGLLVCITKFFYDNHINIIEADIKTEYNQIAKDTFILEYDNPKTIKNLKNQLEHYLVSHS
jgi:UTP:GlnB (protein PII) uridylyltransferase